jgi:class 3 adenylate cyclase
MARLDPAKRAQLPDSAFAYVDPRGHRRLPIYDEAHVRNALSRFNQVAFEDEAACDRARKRLLNAAKKYGIVPVGFINGQVRSARELASLAVRPAVQLPSGFVTMLMTDIEQSTALVSRLQDRYRGLLEDLRGVLRAAAVASGGLVVEARADEFFAAFEAPLAAVDAAVAIQRDLRGRSWLDDLEVRVRIGIHSGYPTLVDANYIGVAVHIAARICDAAHGGQILISGDTKQALRGATTLVRFRNLGGYRLRGIPDEVPLFQVAAKGLASRFPPLRTSP